MVPLALDDPFLSSLLLLDDDDEGLERDLEDFCRVSERNIVGMSSSAATQRTRRPPSTSTCTTSGFDERRAMTVDARTYSSSDDAMMDVVQCITATLLDHSSHDYHQ